MRRTLAIAGLVLFSTVCLGQSKSKAKPLNDASLDRITAAGTADVGGVSAGLSNGVIQFQGQVPTKNGLVTGVGSMAIQSGPITGINMGSISLSDNAQQNLNSLVNITAVNSTISVLLNLNVNINSTVGTVTQSNLNGKH